MNEKPVSYSAIEDHVYRVFPNDLNSHGTVFGGLVMSILDRIALVCAERHSGFSCVTASVDAMHFLAPARRGDNLVIKASVNRTWRSSMEIGLKVIGENPKTNVEKHIVSAYFTFVAVDENNKPISVCPVKPENKIQKRRYNEAEFRRNSRIALAKEKEAYRKKLKNQM